MTFPQIMLIDMNSFFASVEQQANPLLRGQPVGICASMHKSSCLIAASKEAKALGVKTGTLVYEAKKVCPKIVLMQAEPEKYREVNRKLNQIYREYTDKVEEYSIDESFLDLSETRYTFTGSAARFGRRLTVNVPQDARRKTIRAAPTNNALLIACEIKQRIKKEVGDWLTCSIGIGENKFLAKLASDLDKPDGLMLIWRNQLPLVYKNLKLSDLWGIARGWTNRLAKLGVMSPTELLNYPQQNLISIFGKPGFYLWQRIHGFENDQIGLSNNSYHATNEPKSFGNSWVLNFRTKNKKKLEPVILYLAEKATRRMRQENLMAKGIFLSVLLVDGTNFSSSKKLNFCIESGLEFYEQALIIWKPWQFKTEVMRIGVGLIYLKNKNNQLTFWPEKNLNFVTDLVNNKYGEFTIRSGLLINTKDFAPDAIAFGK